MEKQQEEKRETKRRKKLKSLHIMNLDKLGLLDSEAHQEERKQEKPKYEEMCRRFLADAKDFSEENLEKCHITRRFLNNEELSDCIEEVKVAIGKELMV